MCISLLFAVPVKAANSKTLFSTTVLHYMFYSKTTIFVDCRIANLREEARELFLKQLSSVQVKEALEGGHH